MQQLTTEVWASLQRQAADIKGSAEGLSNSLHEQARARARSEDARSSHVHPISQHRAMPPASLDLWGAVMEPIVPPGKEGARPTDMRALPQRAGGQTRRRETERLGRGEEGGPAEG